MQQSIEHPPSTGRMFSAFFILCAFCVALLLTSCDNPTTNTTPGTGTRSSSPSLVTTGPTMFPSLVTTGPTMFPTPLTSTPVVILPGGHPAPQTLSPLVSIHMIGAMTGWAFTKPGYPPVLERLGRGGDILRTVDGGKHWQNVSPKRPVYYVTGSATEFLTAASVWLAEAYTNGTTQVYHTVDGGQTWQETPIVPAPQGSTLLQMTFVDAQNGWILFSTDAQIPNNPPMTIVDLFHTTDGGHTWRKITSSSQTNQPGFLPIDGNISGMGFINASTGWMAGSPRQFATQAPAWFYMTHDGGATWQHQAVSQPANVSSLIIDPPLFFNSRDGLLPVTLQYGAGFSFALYVTHNGGVTWTSTSQVAIGGPLVDCVDSDHCWLYGADESFYTTSNGGIIWTAHSGLIGQMVNFVSSSMGWAIQASTMDRTSLLQTTDGGHTWIPIFQTYMPIPPSCSNPPCG